MQPSKAILCVMIVPAPAGSVRGADSETKIFDKSLSNGEILIFDDGSVYEVVAGDNIVSSSLAYFV